jgi:hypothetical protein
MTVTRLRSEPGGQNSGRATRTGKRAHRGRVSSVTSAVGHDYEEQIERHEEEQAFHAAVCRPAQLHGTPPPGETDGVLCVTCACAVLGVSHDTLSRPAASGPPRRKKPATASGRQSEGLGRGTSKGQVSPGNTLVEQHVAFFPHGGEQGSRLKSRERPADPFAREGTHLFATPMAPWMAPGPAGVASCPGPLPFCCRSASGTMDGPPKSPSRGRRRARALPGHEARLDARDLAGGQTVAELTGGLSRLAMGVANRKLLRLGMIETSLETDWNGNDSSVLRLSAAGERWTETHQARIAGLLASVHARRHAQVAPTTGGDIPF